MVSSWMNADPPPACPCGASLKGGGASECPGCERIRAEIEAEPSKVFHGTAIHALRDEVLAATGQSACMRCVHPTGGDGRLCRYCLEVDRWKR